jgi:hypothetical protein
MINPIRKPRGPPQEVWKEPSQSLTMPLPKVQPISMTQSLQAFMVTLTEWPDVLLVVVGAAMLELVALTMVTKEVSGDDR